MLLGGPCAKDNVETVVPDLEAVEGGRSVDLEFGVTSETQLLIRPANKNFGLFLNSAVKLRKKSVDSVSISIMGGDQLKKDDSQHNRRLSFLVFNTCPLNG